MHFFLSSSSPPVIDGSLRTDDDEDESLAKMPRESSTINRSAKVDLSDEDF